MLSFVYSFACGCTTRCSAPLQLLIIHVRSQVDHLPIADGVLPPARQDCVQVHLALHEDLIILIIAVSCCRCCSGNVRTPSGCTASTPHLLCCTCCSTSWWLTEVALAEKHYHPVAGQLPSLGPGL